MTTLLNAPEIIATDIFQPIRPDFADFSVPVADSFKWGEILQAKQVPVGRFVALYAFRSMRRDGANGDLLQQLDEKALIAAEEAPGFIHYQPYPGLSYCLWESSTLARAAVGSPAHREAARYANEAYEKYELQSWLIGRLTIGTQVEFVPRQLEP